MCNYYLIIKHEVYPAGAVNTGLLTWCICLDFGTVDSVHCPVFSHWLSFPTTLVAWLCSNNVFISVKDVYILVKETLITKYLDLDRRWRSQMKKPEEACRTEQALYVCILLNPQHTKSEQRKKSTRDDMWWAYVNERWHVVSICQWEMTCGEHMSTRDDMWWAYVN